MAMSTKVEVNDERFDTVKIAAAIAIAACGLAAFYVLREYSLLLRWLGLVVAVVVAVVIALQTESGRAAWAFFQETQTEVQKVVWPTQQETLVTTGWVLAAVVVFALILWALDWLLGAGIRALIG